MVWALVVLGVLTLVFGAFVLLRFPDRPGARSGSRAQR